MSAVASATPPFHPTGEYAHFNDCPLNGAGVVSCVYSNTTGGEVKIGSTAVPITNPILLQGGLSNNGNTWVEAADGNTLAKVAQTVPGGLLGIMAPEFLPEWVRVIFNEFINHGPTGVTATTELVGLPGWNQSNLQEEEGTGLTLPVRIHLNNEFLGSGCYIGSSSHPITIALTDGVTPPPYTPVLTGSLGTVHILNEGQLLKATGYKLVGNSFSVPVAEGCGGILSLFVDFAVDVKLGLPSEAGHNSATLKGNLEQAAATAVRASE